MSTPHVLDELSAYVDRECRDPDRIARHLQSCPECARRHLELLTLSAGLQALRAPDVSPAFLARVMARTEEARPPRFWLAGLAPRVAAAACAAALILAAVWTWMPENTPGVASPEAPPLVNVAWRDDAQVLEAFGRLLDAGVALDVFGDVNEAAEAEETGAVSLELLLEVLAEDASDADLGDAFSPYDLAGLLDALADEDVQLLSELLEQSENEV